MRRLSSTSGMRGGGDRGRVSGRTAVSAVEPQQSSPKARSQRDRRLRIAAATTRLALMEARPVVLIIFSLRFCVGGLMGSSAHSLSFWGAGAGHLVWLTAVWAVYLLNGVTDRDEDTANSSLRPIARGLLGPNAALRWCALLSLIALLSAIFVSPLLLALTAVMLMLGLHYSAGARPAKRHGARALLVASAGVHVTYIAGSVAYAGVITNDVLVFAFVMSLWTLAVGSTKDFGDMEGDAAYGRRTLPIVFGLRAAVHLSAAAALLVAFIGAIAALTTQRALPLALLLPAAAVLCVHLGVAAASDGRLELRRPYRAFMVSQFAVNGLAAASFAVGAVRGEP